MGPIGCLRGDLIKLKLSSDTDEQSNLSRLTELLLYVYVLIPFYPLKPWIFGSVSRLGFTCYSFGIFGILTVVGNAIGAVQDYRFMRSSMKQETTSEIAKQQTMSNA